MAEAAVRRASEEEASECLETQSVGAVGDPKMADKKGKLRSTRSSSKSKKDDEDSKIASLEKKMEEQFSTIMTMMQSMSEAQAERDKHAREEREIRASEVQNGGSASHSTRVLNENDPLGLRIGLKRYAPLTIRYVSRYLPHDSIFSVRYIYQLSKAIIVFEMFIFSIILRYLYQTLRSS